MKKSILQGCIRQVVKWTPCAGNDALFLAHGILNGLFFQVRTWNFPAFVKYLTPLNGLYFSPCMSRRLTLRPLQRGERERQTYN